MNSLFQNNYESENDRKLDKKFSYNYQVIKRMYPKASELPEEEVRGIIRKYYQAPKGQEEQVIKDYISQKEPEWQTKYFDEDDENNTLLSPITRMRRQRAKGFLHQSSPETSNMLMDYQALDTSDMLYGAATNNNYQMQKDKEENVDSMPQSSDSAKSFGDYFMDNVADIGYGMKKALSGATFGASDWALRRLGLDNEQEYLAKKQAEGLGGLTQGLGVASEIGGNILGAGGALVKSLQNLGLKGYGLAGAAGGIEGAAYGLTGSDRLTDAPENMAWGAGLGAGLGVGLGLTTPFALQSATRLTQPLNNRVRRYMGNRNLTNQFSNESSKKIKIYRGDDEKAVLKSMVRYLEKTNPDFKFRTLKNETTGRIEKDYDHFLQDPERKRYIHTFIDTYNNPQIKKKGLNNGYEREFRYRVYDNSEHNNLVYDLISNSEKGKTLTKIAREGKHGKESIGKIMGLMPPNSQVSEVGSIASQTEILPSYNANLNNNISFSNSIVNPFKRRGLTQTFADGGIHISNGINIDPRLLAGLPSVMFHNFHDR